MSDGMNHGGGNEVYVAYLRRLIYYEVFRTLYMEDCLERAGGQDMAEVQQRRFWLAYFAVCLGMPVDEVRARLDSQDPPNILARFFRIFLDLFLADEQLGDDELF